MKVLVIGGTRGTGREVVAVAHAAGHELTLPVTGVRVVVGDAGDADDIERAVAGQDAVVWTVGVRPTWRPVHLFSRSTQFLLAAMAKHGVRRLICVTGIGAGDSRGHGGFLYDRIIQPLFMKSVYEDKDRQEAMLRASDLDWTIVRPGTLTNGPATGLARALTDLTGVAAGRISRADVAAFIVEHLQTGEFRRTAVLLTN
jgi:putative NADH-flavin reductase